MSYPPSYPSMPSDGGQYRPPSNGAGTAALVLGILGVLLCGFFTAIPAIFFGISGRRKAARGEASNGGAATAGLVLGIIGTVLGVLGVVLFVSGAVPFTFAP